MADEDGEYLRDLDSTNGNITRREVRAGDRFVRRHPDGTKTFYEAVPGQGMVEIDADGRRMQDLAHEIREAYVRPPTVFSGYGAATREAKWEEFLQSIRASARQEVLARVRAEVVREIGKANRHIAEGTSIGGETAEWHEIAVSAYTAVMAIIDVEERAL